MTIRYEMTDTFGGEPNYGWVKRGTVEVQSNATQHKIMRDVKKALGMTGVPCRLERMWNGWEIKVSHCCCIGWVTFVD